MGEVAKMISGKKMFQAEKKNKLKPRLPRREGIIKIRAEANGTENTKTEKNQPN